MLTYIPASMPQSSCSVLEVAFASCPITQSRHFAISLLHVYPNPTGLNPGFLSSAIS